MFFILSIFIAGAIIDFFIWRSVSERPLKKIEFLDLLLIFPIISLIFGRIFYILGNLSTFLNTHWSVYPFFYLPGAERIWFKEMPWILLNIWNYKGIEFGGVLAGGVIAVFLFKKIRKISNDEFLLWLEAMCFGFIFLLLAFFIKEYYWGKVTNLMVGLKFATVDEESRLPLEIFEVVIFVLLFVILRFLRKSKKDYFSKGLFLFVFGWLEIIVKYFQDGIELKAKNVYYLLFLIFVLVGIFQLIGKVNFPKLYKKESANESRLTNVSRDGFRTYQTSYTDYSRATKPSVFSSLKRKFGGLFKRQKR